MFGSKICECLDVQQVPDMKSSIIMGYDRILIDDNQHIKSVCRKCGAVIIGSASNGLAKNEETHQTDCNERISHLYVLSAEALRCKS